MVNLQGNNAAYARDEGVDIAKGLGILFVIGGHCGIGIQDFHPYSFHIPLFYFIAGFFLADFVKGRYPTTVFLKKKAMALLVPYFWYNLAFGLITFLLPFAHLYIQGVPTQNMAQLSIFGVTFHYQSFETVINLRTLFIEPFITGHQFAISCALWFVPSLFLVMVLVCLTKIILARVWNSPVLLVFWLLLLIIVFYVCCHVGIDNNKLLFVLARSLTGYVYCIFGMFFYFYKKYINNNFLLFIALFVYLSISICFDNYFYDFMQNNYGESYRIYFSFPVTMSGILVVIGISNLLINHDNFINKAGFIFLGKNSYHIMAVHLAFMLLFNVLICLVFPRCHLTDINSIYYRFPHITFAYFFFSACCSYFYVKWLNKHNIWPGLKRILMFWSRDPA